MKDEEMAKEWFNKELYLESSMYNMQIEYYCRQAFLAGLKAGRPQWHDLQKDPNDLPENKRNVWCDYNYGYGKGFYNKEEGGWWIEGHMFCSAIDAWCELPTFDKK